MGSDCDGKTYDVWEPRSQLRASAYAQRSGRVHSTEADDEALVTGRPTGQGSGVWARTDSTAADSAAGHFYHAGASGTTYGVYGQSDSESGRGVYGFASASEGTNYGVWGVSDSSGGYGVYGESHTGVYGSGSAGVKGESTTGRDMHGQATATSATNYGVYTPLGDCALYVAGKTPASFTVRAMGGATCNIALLDYVKTGLTSIANRDILGPALNIAALHSTYSHERSKR